MKKRDLEKRIAELEKRVGEWSWQYVPPEILEPFRYPDPCCPYLDKCTACPHRYRITWRDNTTGTWTDTNTIQVTYT